MRESGDGWNALPLGGNTYSPGEKVVSVVDGERGIVVSVDAFSANQCFAVRWKHGAETVFPVDTQNVRKAYPWE